MDISLQRFASIDIDYIAKSNDNCAVIEQTLNQMEAAISGDVVQSLPFSLLYLFQALLGKATALVGSYGDGSGAISAIGNAVRVDVQTTGHQYAWLPAANSLVDLGPQLLSTTGAGLWYLEAGPGGLTLSAQRTSSSLWSFTATAPTESGQPWTASELVQLVPTLPLAPYDVAQFVVGPLPADLEFSYQGKPGDGALLGLVKLARAINVPIGGYSTCAVGTNPAAPVALTIKKNGTSVGTFNVGTDGSAYISFLGFTAAAGDVIAVYGPSPADSAMADVALVIRATLS